MSWLSKFLDDSEDWFKEEILNDGLAWFKIFGNAIIKQIRLKWQEKANYYINEAENVTAKAGVELMHEYLPELAGVSDVKLEQLVRKLYWKPLNYIKEKWDADWLIDT